MKFTRVVAFSIYALVYLAQGNGRLTLAKQIAQAHGFPLISLRWCLFHLKAAGILRSQRGVTGGFRLARAPASITLLEIVEAVEGPIRGSIPPDGWDTLQAVADQVAEGTRAELGKVTLASLIGTGKNEQ